MTIGQLARSQQLMYTFYAKNIDYASQAQFQEPSTSANSWNGPQKVDPDDLLQQMGLSGLEGRTIREMAQNKLNKVLEESQIQLPEKGGLAPSDLSSIAQKLTDRVLHTPIPEETTAAVQNLALQDAINSAGKGTSSGITLQDRLGLIQEHLEKVPYSKRPAAYNTMNAVWEREIDRIGAYIKEQDPAWETWGDPFDTSILEGYIPGVDVWA